MRPTRPPAFSPCRRISWLTEDRQVAKTSWGVAIHTTGTWIGTRTTHASYHQVSGPITRILVDGGHARAKRPAAALCIEPRSPRHRRLSQGQNREDSTSEIVDRMKEMLDPGRLPQGVRRAASRLQRRCDRRPEQPAAAEDFSALPPRRSTRRTAGAPPSIRARRPLSHLWRDRAKLISPAW